MQAMSEDWLGNRTKGGAGGPTTTVTTLEQLRAVANATGPQIILVQGAIKGAAKVQVGSNKSIIGKAGSCMFNSVQSEWNSADQLQ